jgi:biotin carboxylase
MSSAASVVLVVSTTSYRTDAFLEASRKLGVRVLLASDRCHVLDGHWTWPEDSLVIDFGAPEEAARVIVEAARNPRFAPVRAVVAASGEPAVVVAAMASEGLGLPSNAVSAAVAAGNKFAMRTMCSQAGLPVPRFVCFDVARDPAQAAAEVEVAVGWPCVLKPLLLSGSRGVLRADDAEGFLVAFARLCRLLRAPELEQADIVASRQVLCEAFVPGAEVALEGLLTDGVLRTLALFDKPDRLDGPFFEETLYVTPSRLPEPTQEGIVLATAAAAAALGLRTGPVHAEIRVPAHGPPVVLEIAARTIGGLCAATLRFGAGRSAERATASGTGLSLEELVLRHALGQDMAATERQQAATGVMMIPIPRAGVLRSVDGIDSARRVDGIEDIVLSTRLGEKLSPLPEGSSYLGFIFARGETPVFVEQALRAAHSLLSFSITPTLPVDPGGQ